MSMQAGVSVLAGACSPASAVLTSSTAPPTVFLFRPAMAARDSGMVASFTKANDLESLEFRTSLQVSTLPYSEKRAVMSCSDCRDGGRFET